MPAPATAPPPAIMSAPTNPQRNSMPNPPVSAPSTTPLTTTSPPTTSAPLHPTPTTVPTSAASNPSKPSKAAPSIAAKPPEPASSNTSKPPEAPPSAPSEPPSLPKPILSNLPHLQDLVLLGRVWHRPLVLRITITPPFPPETAASTLSFHAVKRAESAAFPPHSEQSPVEATSDLTGKLYSAFRHLIVEREQRRVFGRHYTGSLRDKVISMLATFDKGDPVHLFLQDLAIADCIQCDVNHPLALALDEIRQLAKRFSPFEQPEREEWHEVQVFGGIVKVDVGRFGLSKVIFENDEDVDGELSTAAAKLVHEVCKERTGVGVDGRAEGDGVKDVYAWEWPLSEVARGREADVGVSRYAKIAAVAIKVAAERTKECLSRLGVDMEDWVRFVAEVVGKEQAVYFAAVESSGGIQRGVRDLSYSRWEGEGEVSVAATVAGLRDVGRMGFENNVVEGGVSGEGRRIVVFKEGGLVTVPEGEGEVGERLPEDTLVR